MGCDNGCVTPGPMPAPTQDCGHILDCTNITDGWYADPFNCRKYWHCLEGNGVHYMCEDDLQYDPVNIWCNYPDNIWCNYPDKVNCGGRPICDLCDQNCT